MSVDARCSPYASAAWGRHVATVFGGSFERHVVCLAGGQRKARELQVPILRGGRLAAAGFVCGHIGYGGVYDSRTGQAAPLRRQLDALAQLSEALGEPCLRLVTPPLRPEQLSAPRWDAHRSQTAIKVLGGAGELRASYDGGVRTALRKILRQPGLRVGLLAAPERGAAVELIHATQERVESPYLSPPALIEGMIPEAPTPHFLAVGAWLRDELISVGCFVLNGREAAYYLNGWSARARELGPNYAMLDAALQLLSLRGVERVDLGCSHHSALADHKRRWGAELHTFLRLSNPTQHTRS
ncbi:hypothetical protein ENSA5_65570 [Enhygromyxa salina]|uniref:BioF2-like acetyltransferase domain-containing protein n=1 Tax=Enhygromyxa salina TaxID=215803 RepID=A0A2S9XC04_9BACT|nr:GNAT family N-acetyltransferase [Enhygromyxa salina]PRP90330.1 hypothetical protein ENSA5_65570 [Enhygromyxa salina]